LRELGATEHTEMWKEIVPTYLDWSTFMGTGDYWIVRSDDISIQARYAERGWINGLVIGGPFVKGHKFEVTDIGGSGADWDGFAMTWDDRRVFESFPSEFSVDSLIHIKYTTDRFYQAVSVSHSDRSGNTWRDSTPLRLLEISTPGGVRITIALGKNVRHWEKRFMDVFITMPFQASGQDGHCGRGMRDFNIDWQGSALAAGETLFSWTPPALLFADKARLAAARTDCVGGEEVEDNRGACESVLEPTEFGMLFAKACMQDVCTGGQEMLERYEAFALRVFHEYAAEAQAKRKCLFPGEPHGVGYYWDPACTMGESLGCGADGAHAECRLCGGTGVYASVVCPGEEDP